MKFALRSLAASCAVALSLNATAATQGTAGADSTGDILINLTLSPQIIIGGLEDVALTDALPSNAQQVCVGGFGFTNYSIDFGSLNGNAKVGAANGTDPFLLQGTTVTTESVPYSVAFINDTTSATGTDSTDGTIAGTFARANSLAECTGAAPTANNAQIFIAVDPADWADVTDATFSDTLTVTVTAE